MDKIKSDPRFIQAKEFIKAGEYERALEFYGQLLETSVETYGEKALELAPLYFEYGSALLCQAQEATDVFGSAIKDAQKSKRDAEPSKEAEEEETNDGEEEEEGPTEEGVQEDLEIAWENLEVARTICSENETEESKKLLTEVYLKLADLNTLNGNYPQAVEDYNSSLSIREAMVEAHSRLLAEVHFSLAHAYEYYLASEKEKDPNFTGDQGLLCLKHFRHVLEILQLRVKFLEDRSASEDEAAADAKEIEEINELIDEVQETIEAKGKELEEGGVSVKESIPQTSIGFDKPSSDPDAANAIPVTKVQVKRKVHPSGGVKSEKPSSIAEAKQESLDFKQTEAVDKKPKGIPSELAEAEPIDLC